MNSTSPVAFINAIAAALSFSAVPIFSLFGTIVWRHWRGQAAQPHDLFFLPISMRHVHLFLGIILLALTCWVAICLWALAVSEPSPRELQVIQQKEVKLFGVVPGGALFNPFYTQRFTVLTKFSYALLIVLWWVGMYTFWYSLNANESASHLLVGWYVIVSLTYLVLGIASMLAIQLCWLRFGAQLYRERWAWSLIGIGIGAMLPPLLLRGYQSKIEAVLLHAIKQAFARAA